jgi:HAD superfamily hydrolase (TIGR01509 family)
VIDAVVFDLDGVLLDSEELWDEVREELVRERDDRWHERAQVDMMGMSSVEWSRYMHEQLGVPDPREAISAEVVRRMLERYRSQLPLTPGAVDTVRRLAARWPLALASSSNRELIDAALAAAGLTELFATTVSSEEVERGKPAPDVYLEAARRIGAAADRCAAIEDSQNGILSARAAGMRVIAVPNRSFPPDDEALAAADVVIGSLEKLTPEVIAA